MVRVTVSVGGRCIRLNPKTNPDATPGLTITVTLILILNRNCNRNVHDAPVNTRTGKCGTPQC